MRDSSPRPSRRLDGEAAPADGLDGEAGPARDLTATLPTQGVLAMADTRAACVPAHVRNTGRERYLGIFASEAATILGRGERATDG